MLALGGPGNLQQTTSYKVVLPFYVYAGISFIVGTIMLLLHTDVVQSHYFNPFTLAITHVMALGWGLMIIFGASHQLVPVLIEGKLDSNSLAYATFLFAGIGIPFIVIGFYVFNLGWMLQTGAVLVNIGVICYLANIFTSAFKSGKHDIHSWFVVTAALWLFATTFLGLLLVLNFTKPLLPSDSVAYLTIHAHLGIVGWFLLLVIGVASRLIPMFLISKYTNNKSLWWIYALINFSLISFLVFKLLNLNSHFYYISMIMALVAILLFARHIKRAHKVRIRKNVDEQMKISLLSVLQMLLPLVVLIVVLFLLPTEKNNIILLYGFCIFFGWLTAIILGMTFKTLPFIIWNRTYHKKAHAGKTPAPKELFNPHIYNAMAIVYIVGFVIFIVGIVLINNVLLKTGAIALIITALLYVFNTTIALTHKPKKI